MPRKKDRHRAVGEHFSLDIPFNRTFPIIRLSRNFFRSFKLGCFVDSYNEVLATRLVIASTGAMLTVGHEAPCRLAALACRTESPHHTGKEDILRQVSCTSEASKTQLRLSELFVYFVGTPPAFAITCILLPIIHIQMSVAARKMRWSSPPKPLWPNGSRTKKEARASTDRSIAGRQTERHSLSQRRAKDKSKRATVALVNAIIPI